jgi:hypothetical protein
MEVIEPIKENLIQESEDLNTIQEET